MNYIFKKNEEDLFRRYVAVQFSGLYNMITEANSAWELAEISMDDYFAVQDHYGELYKKYPDAYKKARKLGEELSRKSDLGGE